MLNILYSVQATGNGHISRATELYPILSKVANVDMMLSGSNAHLDAPMPIKYRSRGLSLIYNCNGGINSMAVLSQMKFSSLYHDARELPVEKYDIVINDFDFVTSWACRIKKKKSIQLGHQASFLSGNTPRPENVSRLGEFILRNYCKATDNLGLHFRPYDHDIFSPVIKKRVLESDPTRGQYVVVYLNQYCIKELMHKFKQFSNVRFKIYAKECKARYESENLEFLPVNNEDFTNAFIGCRGIITGGGFETPAEALYMNKNLMVIPIKGQYEQMCNAEALKEWNIPVLNHIDELEPEIFYPWYDAVNDYDYRLTHTTERIVEETLYKGMEQQGPGYEDSY